MQQHHDSMRAGGYAAEQQWCHGQAGLQAPCHSASETGHSACTGCHGWQLTCRRCWVHKQKQAWAERHMSACCSGASMTTTPQRSMASTALLRAGMHCSMLPLEEVMTKGVPCPKPCSAGRSEISAAGLGFLPVDGVPTGWWQFLRSPTCTNQMRSRLAAAWSQSPLVHSHVYRLGNSLALQRCTVVLCLQRQCSSSLHCSLDDKNIDTWAPCCMHDDVATKIMLIFACQHTVLLASIICIALQFWSLQQA